jgi:DNA-binding transcriptional LysR family regulator
MMDQASAAQQIHLEIVLQASAPAAVADLAYRSFGVAILTESMAALHVGRLTSLVIDDIKSPAGLALVWKSTRTTTSPALREFLAFGREALSTGG